MPTVEREMTANDPVGMMVPFSQTSRFLQNSPGMAVNAYRPSSHTMRSLEMA